MLRLASTVHFQTDLWPWFPVTLAYKNVPHSTAGALCHRSRLVASMGKPGLSLATTGLNHPTLHSTEGLSLGEWTWWPGLHDSCPVYSGHPTYRSRAYTGGSTEVRDRIYIYRNIVSKVPESNPYRNRLATLPRKMLFTATANKAPKSKGTWLA